MKKISLMILTSICLIFFQLSSIYAEGLDVSPEDVGISSQEPEAAAPDMEHDSALPEILAPSYVLMDADTGVILCEKNMDERYYPASITKVMTALLSIEYAQGDLSERITFSHNAVFSLPYGSSHIAMDEDETLTIEEALYGLLLESANEVANALAEHIGGDIDTFGEMMTRRAQELGAVNTHFTNPHGLHSEDHYTTAKDMAIIMREAIQNPSFLNFISTRFYELPPTEKQPLQRPLNNSNKLIQPGSYYNENVVGGKTGYTDEARHTLVTYARKGGINLIAVTLGDEKGAIYTDSTSLYEYGFEQFEEVQIFDKDSFQEEISVIQVDGSDVGKVDGSDVDEIGRITAVAQESIRRVLPKCVIGNIEQVVELPEQIAAPVTYGDVIGKITFIYPEQDIILEEAQLIALDTVGPLAIDENSVSEDGKEADTSQLISILPILVVAAIVVPVVLGTLIWFFFIRKRRRKRTRYATYRFKDSRYN